MAKTPKAKDNKPQASEDITFTPPVSIAPDTTPANTTDTNATAQTALEKRIDELNEKKRKP